MGFNNNVSVVGNVTRDPELRFSAGGMAVAGFGLAWNKRKQNDEEEVSFFDVTCFRSLAENVAESITKGSRVVVQGTLSQRSWENQQGERRSRVEIVADEVAPSLMWATAEVKRNEFRGESGAGPPRRAEGSWSPGEVPSDTGSSRGRQVSDKQPTSYTADEEPF